MISEKRVKEKLKDLQRLSQLGHINTQQKQILERYIKTCECNIEWAKNKISELEIEKQNIINSFSDVQQVINKLSTTEQLIIHYRYIKNYKWEKLPFLMYYSERQLLNIHKKLIKKLSKLL